MKYADFSIRVIADNPHARGSDRWRAGQIVAAMEGNAIKLSQSSRIELDISNT
jgi:hypothetical protein